MNLFAVDLGRCKTLINIRISKGFISKIKILYTQRGTQMVKRGIAVILMAASCISPVLAEDEDKEAFLEEVRIIGNREDAQQVAGSAHFIGQEELEKFNY